MDEAEVREALATVDLRPTLVRPILGGWSSWTFELDGVHIVRFPRHDEIAAATRCELALLPELADHVSFSVPEPTHVGDWAGHPFFAYRTLAGRALQPDGGSPALFDQLRHALIELHSFPVDRAAALLGAGPPEHAWRRHYERLMPLVEEHVLPLLDPTLAARVQDLLMAFVDRCDDLPHCLIHNDLGLEHLLVAETTGSLAGIIDFEDATVGDPAIDIVPLRAAFGPEATARILQGRDLGDDLEERLHLYRWMGSVHAIIYGVTQVEEDELRSGLEELPRRFNAPVGRALGRADARSSERACDTR